MSSQIYREIYLPASTNSKWKDIRLNTGVSAYLNPKSYKNRKIKIRGYILSLVHISLWGISHQPVSNVGGVVC